ncbi:MarR family winged helix-turn-helix transcriptional regulator [Mycolicibacterium frederiksbergense]|uniref:MarR family winged helix-turn-helix transcriptional regulator n=1 Tax=Mycolicibacterium frederiksbergense TaxID=117567 RepID=UPI0024742907|nr:MarR family transcriptional regulator [Mycolicibacterium frederiksbergense]
MDSISATLAQIVRLNLSRSAFKSQATTADTELSQPSYALLRVLIDEGPQPTGQLAKKAHMDPGMATRRVKALVEAGLISRHADHGDGRISIVEATDDGRHSAAALQELRRDHLARALSAWSATDLRQLDQLLARFLDDTKHTPIGER